MSWLPRKKRCCSFNVIHLHHQTAEVGRSCCYRVVVIIPHDRCDATSAFARCVYGTQGVCVIQQHSCGSSDDSRTVGAAVKRSLHKTCSRRGSDNAVVAGKEHCNSRVTLAAIDDARIKTCSSLSHPRTVLAGWIYCNAKSSHLLSLFRSAPRRSLDRSRFMYYQRWRGEKNSFSDLRKNSFFLSPCPSFFFFLFVMYLRSTSGSSQRLGISYLNGKRTNRKPNCDELIFGKISSVD